MSSPYRLLAFVKPCFLVQATVFMCQFLTCLLTTFNHLTKICISFRLQCFSTCQAANFASTTSCTFGGFFWSTTRSFDKQSSYHIISRKLSSRMSPIQSQENNVDLRSDLPRSLSQLLRPLSPTQRSAR